MKRIARTTFAIVFILLVIMSTVTAENYWKMHWKPGEYMVSFTPEEDVETKATQLMWDIMFTTDPEFLSDGYRVQFQRVIEHETGEEKIYDVIVEHANLGSG